jgi:AraC family transcriptional regulator
MTGGDPIFAAAPAVNLYPAHVQKRQSAHWRGLQVETFEATHREPFEYSYHGGRHLLIAADTALRQDGETLVDGLPKSTLRDLSGKLTFVPAGHRFRSWHKPRVLARSLFVYIDPKSPVLPADVPLTGMDLKPKLFFSDQDLWETVHKLKRSLERPTQALYAEALEVVLAHELSRLDGPQAANGVAKGGLAAWQKKRVSEYIEANFAEDISLAALAQIAGLSPYHFARAFKETFGLPPHRYHMQKRIEQAKALLARPGISVTEAGLRTGFSETSAFSAAFRKITHQSPTEYRRSLE